MYVMWAMVQLLCQALVIEGVVIMDSCSIATIFCYSVQQYLLDHTCIGSHIHPRYGGGRSLTADSI